MRRRQPLVPGQLAHAADPAATVASRAGGRSHSGSRSKKKRQRRALRLDDPIEGRHQIERSALRRLCRLVLQLPEQRRELQQAEIAGRRYQLVREVADAIEAAVGGVAMKQVRGRVQARDHRARQSRRLVAADTRLEILQHVHAQELGRFAPPPTGPRRRLPAATALRSRRVRRSIGLAMCAFMPTQRAALDVLARGVAGHRDDRDVALPRRQRADPVHLLVAVHHRHLHVHEDEFVVRVADRGTALGAVARDSTESPAWVRRAPAICGHPTSSTSRMSSVRRMLATTEISAGRVYGSPRSNRR